MSSQKTFFFLCVFCLCFCCCTPMNFYLLHTESVSLASYSPGAFPGQRLAVHNVGCWRLFRVKLLDCCVYTIVRKCDSEIIIFVNSIWYFIFILCGQKLELHMSCTMKFQCVLARWFFLCLQTFVDHAIKVVWNPIILQVYIFVFVVCRPLFPVLYPLMGFYLCHMSFVLQYIQVYGECKTRLKWY